jgi:CheY-like chemotaxis protein
MNPSCYSLILMDLEMPVMDGLEATRVIRKMEHEEGVGVPMPIVAVTGNARQQYIDDSKEAGMQGGMKTSVHIICSTYLS